jgi:hypothetical protein
MLSLELINQKLDAISEAQGKLYAALGDHESALRALNNKQDEIHCSISGQIKGLGDGLADELKQLTAAVSFFAQSALKQRRKAKERK